MHGPWRSLYPFQSRELVVGGHRYHYLDEGQGDVLLLVHGNPTWSFHWRNLIGPLARKYRVIAVDHMGCGLSDKPSHYSYRLSQHVDNLAQFVKRLNLERVTLVGHDWGGAIGLGAAHREPQRFARFVMMNSAAFRSQSMPWRIRACRVPLVGQLAVQGLNAFVRAALHMAVVRHNRMTPEVRAGYLAPYDSWNNRQAIYRFIADIPMSPRHPSYHDLLAIEQSLPMWSAHPWMFIWGMRDWCFTGAFLDRFLSFFPQAQVHRLAEAGHWVVEDAYEQIIPLVERFIAGHPLNASASAVQPAPAARPS